MTGCGTNIHGSAYINEARVTFKLFWCMKKLFSQEKKKIKYVILIYERWVLRERIIIDCSGTLMLVVSVRCTVNNDN